jgi:hypothetical protein
LIFASGLVEVMLHVLHEVGYRVGVFHRLEKTGSHCLHIPGLDGKTGCLKRETLDVYGYRMVGITGVGNRKATFPEHPQDRFHICEFVGSQGPFGPDAANPVVFRHRSMC